jgi:drug/metabolite transporter (DMT)-like permease
VNRRPWSAKALVAVAVWGASFPATRLALESFHPLGLVAVRLAVGAILLTLLVRGIGRSALRLGPDTARCLFLGVVLGVHLLIQAYGLQYTSAIRTGWIIAFIPALIALGAHLFLRQRLGPVGWIGIALAWGGVLLVTGPPEADFVRARLGDALQMLSGVTWTVYTLAATRPIARNGSLPVTAFTMVVAALVVGPPAVWAGVLSEPLTVRSFAALAFLAVMASGLAYALWLRALEEQGATRLGAMLYFEPFFTMATAAILLHETVTPWVILGGAAVLLGVWLVGKGSRG